MSTDGKERACSSDKEVNYEECEDDRCFRCDDDICEKKRLKPVRKVCFPEDDQLVTQYFEPANPWQDVPPISRAQLAADYLEWCRRHGTPPIDSVLRQIREFPESCLGGGGGGRAPRLSLDGCVLAGAAPADALEAVLRRAQFRRIDIEHAHIDDECAEALFDMVEYYESACVLCISGPRAFGIRGWQAASRMIKKSAHLTELELCNHPLEPSHAPVLSRALHAHSCRLRVLSLQRCALAGDPLLCLVIALKSNGSVRELRLGDNRLGPADAAQLGALLRHNARLQLLDLSHNHVQDSGFAHIADALAEQAARSPPHPAPASPPALPADPAAPPPPPLGIEPRGLAFLVLWNNQLTRNCAPHLSKALLSPSLCVLNIGRNALGGDTVRALCGGGSGSGGGALVSLGLQAARLGPDAARPLHDLIATTALQRLDLRDNKLGSVGLSCVLDALQHSTTLSQVDLDDPPAPAPAPAPASAPTQECPSSLSAAGLGAGAGAGESEPALVARLTAAIRARCREQSPPASPPRAAALGRKISLTCHAQPHPPHPATAPPPAPAPAPHGPGAEPEGARCGRLRSPLPSPASSPVPPTHSRFSVSRVAGPAAGGAGGATPPSPTPSRFKVVQVTEPPQIQVSSPAGCGGRGSRFSVTRNYDVMYEPAPSPSPCSTPSPCPTPSPSPSPPPPSKVQPHEQPSAIDTHLHPNDNVHCEKCENLSQSQVYKDKSEEVTHCASVDVDRGDAVLKTETKVVKNTTEKTPTEKVDVEIQVTVKSEIKPTQHIDQRVTSKLEDPKPHKDPMKQIEAITEDLGVLIQEMRDLSTKTKKVIEHPDGEAKIEVPANIIRDNVVLKKNKSESSLDSPDLEVSRLMMKKLEGSPFCDSSSSLEISGSSMESLAEPTVQTRPIIIQESVESDTELDRRKPDRVALSTESSVESNTSDTTPVNSGHFLNTSVSSNESVSPIFGQTKKIHDSLSSLEASVSSLDSKDKIMVTSADSGIEYSLQHPTESRDDTSSNEGTLTNNSSLKETTCKQESSQVFQLQDTLTSPKRTASLLDVPALKSKGLERMRKISWVAPSSSYHIPRPEPPPEKVEPKLPSHLDKLLSLFQHPTSLFSRGSTEEDKKVSTSTPPKKDSSLTNVFWSWGSAAEKEKEEKEDSSEATDSTLSERNQVAYVDESFSRKLDSKTPSTDTENTLSEFQSLPTQGNSEASDASQADKVDRVTELTTDNLVQKSLVLSVNSTEDASSNGNKAPGACDSIDLIKPNDLNKNYQDAKSGEKGAVDEVREVREAVRPRSFAAVLSASGSANSLDKQASPEGQPVAKLPSKVIRGIKENISPENTLTASMTNTNTLAVELAEKQDRNPHAGIGSISTVWEIDSVIHGKEAKAPIATIEETCDDTIDSVCSEPLQFIDDERNISADSGVTSLDGAEDKTHVRVKELEAVDLGKDALSYLIYESQDFEPESEQNVPNVSQEGSLAQELKEAENKEKLLDLSPELVIDEAIEVPEVFVAKDLAGLRTSPVIPERAKLKKANSLEELSQTDESPKAKTIAFKIPETTPRDIPQKRGKLRSRSGSSPKSLPDSLNRPMGETFTCKKKKKKVSSLGKIAKDSLLALNMTEEEIAEFRRSYKLTSVESLKSLESVSEDANSQSGTSADSRCRACLRMSQESLMSLDSITEDCKCSDECDKADKLARSIR